MPYVASWERRAEKRGEERGVKLGEERGVKLGEERGEKRGVKKGKRETALELIRLGVDFEIISKSTGFPKKEIEKLAASLR